MDYIYLVDLQSGKPKFLLLNDSAFNKPFSNSKDIVSTIIKSCKIVEDTKNLGNINSAKKINFDKLKAKTFEPEISSPTIKSKLEKPDSNIVIIAKCMKNNDIQGYVLFSSASNKFQYQDADKIKGHLHQIVNIQMNGAEFELNQSIPQIKVAFEDKNDITEYIGAKIDSEGKLYTDKQGRQIKAVINDKEGTYKGAPCKVGSYIFKQLQEGTVGDQIMVISKDSFGKNYKPVEVKDKPKAEAKSTKDNKSADKKEPIPVIVEEKEEVLKGYELVADAIKAVYVKANAENTFGIASPKGIIYNGTPSNQLGEETEVENLLNSFNMKELIDSDDITEQIIDDIYKNKKSNYTFSKLWSKILCTSNPEPITITRYINKVNEAIKKYLTKYNIKSNTTNPDYDAFVECCAKCFSSILVLVEFIPEVATEVLYCGPITMTDLREHNAYINKGDDRVVNDLTYPLHKYSYLSIKFGKKKGLAIYNDMPFFAHKIWKQVKEDIKDNSSISVTFGRNERGELVTNDKFFTSEGQQDKILTLAADSGSGKGVLGLCLVANALKANMGLIYLDNKPDMARTLFNASGKFKSLTIDGLSDSTLGNRIIDRKIDDKQPYLQYALSTIPKEFLEVVGQDLCERLVNAISYTRMVEIVTNYINQSSQDRSATRLFFIIDEIQKYSAGLNDLMFKGECKEAPYGGHIGTQVKNASDSKVKRYYSELNNWFKRVWSSLAQCTSATIRQANISIMIILQNGEDFATVAPPFLYKAVSSVSNSATFLYGTKSLNNSNFSSRDCMRDLAQTEDFNGMAQEGISSKVFGMGHFVYKEPKKAAVRLNTCLILNDAIDNEGKIIYGNGKGSLWKILSNPSTKEVLRRQIYGNPNISDEEMQTTVIPEESRLVDFNRWCDRVINFNNKTGSPKSIGSQMEIGYELIKRYIPKNYGEEVKDKEFFSMLFDVNPVNMGIRSNKKDFIEEIISLSKKYTILFDGEDPIIKIPSIEGSLANYYEIQLPTEDAQNEFFRTRMNPDNPAFANNYKNYIEQKSGSCDRSDAIKHEDIFKYLEAFIKENNITVLSSVQEKSNPFITAILKAAGSRAAYADLLSEAKSGHIIIDVEHNKYTLSEEAENIIKGTLHEANYNKQTAGTCAEKDLKECALDIFDYILANLKNNKKASSSQDNYSSLEKTMADAFNKVSKKNPQKGDIIAFNNIKNRLLEEYKGNPEALNIINSYESNEMGNIQDILGGGAKEGQGSSQEPQKKAITAFMSKNAEEKDYLKQQRQGLFTLYDTGDYSNLIKTTSVAIELPEDAKILKMSKAKIEQKFMEKFFATLKKKKIPMSKIKVLQLTPQEIIVNEQRVHIPLPSGVDISKLWDWKFNSIRVPGISPKLNPTVLSVSPEFIESLVWQCKLNAKGPTTSAIKYVFKKYSKLQDFYINGLKVNKADVKALESKEIYNKIQLKDKEHEQRDLLKLYKLSLKNNTTNNSKDQNQLNKDIQDDEQERLYQKYRKENKLTLDFRGTERLGRTIGRGVIGVAKLPFKLIRSVFRWIF